MTRPDLVRADTLDLQDPSSPSAKDHSRQPASPKALGDGPPAPHQAQSLRRASGDAHDLNVRSPRGSKDLSDKELQLLHDADGEEREGAGDGGHDAADQDLAGQDMIDDDDDDDDDESEDDMMDKISSSPSIDDGVYNSRPAWPRRGDSLLHNRFPVDSAGDLRNAGGLMFPQSLPMMRNDFNFEIDQSSQLYLPQPESGFRIEGLRSTRRDEKEKTAARSKSSHLGASSQCSQQTLERPYLEIAEMEHALIESNWTRPNEAPASASEHIVPFGILDSEPDSSSDKSFDSTSVVDTDPGLWDDERFIDSGWGGECLREIEDIDFEFVYALHTFVATVEGQANATKGDTMVLLDDSNSYWWLVKVVKDSSIGYLPAEHIETPTERLARLNKHRNIDVGHPSDDEDDDVNSQQLSQTMLGDNTDKPRNPLKITIRRRGAKTVQFTDPIYYEPSIRSYSSDEEEDDLMSPILQNGQDQGQTQDQAQEQAQTQQEETQTAEEADVVEPLRTSREKTHSVDEGTLRSTDSGTTLVTDGDRTRTSQDTLDSRDEEGRGGRRMRNTDSFYKDEETKKISLTPGLLRDDQAASAVEDTRASLDSQKSSEKNSVKDEKPKEKKEKKSGGMFSIFRRKNSKSKTDKEDEQDEAAAATATVVSPKPSSESLSHDSASVTSPVTSPQSAKAGKLQKAPPPRTTSSKRGQATEEQTSPQKSANDAPRAMDEAADLSPAPLRQGRQDPPAPLNLDKADDKASGESRSVGSGSSLNKGLFSPIQTVQTILSTATGNGEPKEPKPEKVKKAKSRMALEDSEDSDDDTSINPTLINAPSNTNQASTSLRAQPTPYALDTKPGAAASQRDRLSESPIEVSPVASSSHLAPGLSSTSQLDVPPSPVSAISAVSTPELIERPGDVASTAEPTRSLNQQHSKPSFGAAPNTTVTKTPDINATPSTSTMSSPVTAPTTPHHWSPSALRAYLEADGANDVRDLMLLVQDTSDVKGLPQHHELMRGFDSERQRLDGISRKLDDLLGEVLARKPTPPVSAT